MKTPRAILYETIPLRQIFIQVITALTDQKIPPTQRNRARVIRKSGNSLLKTKRMGYFHVLNAPNVLR